MRKMLLSMLAVTVLLGTAGLCSAQDELKPLVTVSFAGYDKLMADIDMIGRIGRQPQPRQGAGDDAQDDDPGQGPGRPRHQAALGRRAADRRQAADPRPTASFPSPT